MRKQNTSLTHLYKIVCTSYKGHIMTHATYVESNPAKIHYYCKYVCIPRIGTF